MFGTPQMAVFMHLGSFLRVSLQCEPGEPYHSRSITGPPEFWKLI